MASFSSLIIAENALKLGFEESAVMNVRNGVE